MSVISKSLTFMSGVSYTTFGSVFLSTAVVILIGEHWGRKRGSQFRPSVGLEIASNKSRNLFRALGKKCALISSYLTQIDLKEISVTIEDVMRPAWNLVTSPLCTVSGYVRTAATYGRKQWMVYAGSALGIILVSYGAYQYIDYFPLSYLNRFESLLRLTN